MMTATQGMFGLVRKTLSRLFGGTASTAETPTATVESQAARYIACSNFVVGRRAFFESLESETEFRYYSINKPITEYALARPPRRVHIWGMIETPGLLSYAAKNGVPIRRYEEGFLPRPPGVTSHSVPLSFVQDESGLYYNASQPSDLERLINSYDFDYNAEVVLRGKKAMQRMLRHQVSRYMLRPTAKAEALYGEKNRTRILCIGQQPESPQCKFSGTEPYSPDALIMAAQAQYPDAEIIFSLSGEGFKKNPPAELLPTVPCHQVVTEALSIDDLLTGVDAVVTYSAFEGFESLMRGVTVHCLGLPFYAGWGLTQDATPCPRRTQTPTLEALFTCVYLLYPNYVVPETRVPCELEHALDALIGATVYASNFAKWKRDELNRLFPTQHIHHVPIRQHIETLAIPKTGGVAVYIWGMRSASGLVQYALDHDVPLSHFEDGLIRSVGLGAEHVPSLSYCKDDTGIYFNAQQPSDLETLIQHFPFQEHPAFLERAKACMQTIVQHKLGKYNLPETNKAKDLYGSNTRMRILCIGQVEDDASILYGCEQAITNNQLVEQAARDYPEAQIIYKAHPDVIAMKREAYTNPHNVAHLCTLVTESMSLDDALTGVDMVYTITSLAGFEALLRGIPVVCLGMPFYAGWGLTEDKTTCSRRTRTCTLTEVFAAAYLLYPTYVDVNSHRPTTLENTLAQLIPLKQN